MIGSLLGAFTGRTQQRATDRASREATGFLQQGQQQGESALGRGYGDAQGFLAPYAQQGGRANALYGRAIGLDGSGPQREFMNQYAQGDPFRQFNEDQASRALARRYQAMGMGGSGAMALGLSRAQLERGSQDYESYVNRLAGQAGQGAQFAAQQAGLASGYGQGLAGLRTGTAQQMAGNAINYGNASAQNSGILMNNLMGLGGLAVNAFGRTSPRAA